MKQLIIDWIYLNPRKVSIIALLLIIMITVSLLNEDPKELTPQELETKLKQEITNLDSQRDTKLNDLQKVIDDAAKCREFITKDKGTTAPIKECSEYSTVIPVANAMEQTTGTATGAINPVS